MTLSPREIVTGVHGMVLGGAFLLAFTGSAASLWSIRPGWLTAAGFDAAVRRLLVGAWAMALLAWMTVLVGTFAVYPWYRAAPPKGTTAGQLAAYPKAALVADPQTAGWHTLGMEWKEHVGWLAPILATAVAVTATRSRRSLLDQPAVRRAMMFLLTASFFCAGVAGFLGAMIDKMAPVK